MSPQNFVVAWKEHYGELVSVFENLLRRSALVDCTLAAEGQFLKAHQVVLSACSPYFELLFSGIGEKHPIVILKDIAFQDLKIAVDFMYKGEVEICEDRFSAFLEIAQTLHIKGLRKAQGTNESDRKIAAASVVSGNTAINSGNILRRYSTATNVQVQDTDESTSVPIGSSQFSDDKLSSGRESSIPANTVASSSNMIYSSSLLVSEMKSEPRNHENNQYSFLPMPCLENMTLCAQTVSKATAYGGMDADSENECEEVFEEDITLVDPEHWVEEKKENAITEHATSQEYGDVIPSCEVTEDLSSRRLFASETENRPMLEDLPSAHETEHPASDSIVVSENRDQFTPKGAADESEECEAPVRNKQFYVPVETICFAKSAVIAGDTTSETEIRSVKTLDLQPPKKSLTTGQPPDDNTRMKTPMNSKRFKCRDCKYTVNRHADVVKHTCTHTGEKPYKCSECEYATTQKSRLNLHKRTHTGERPFKCDECEFVTSQKGNLIIHKRIHTNERPFKCSECKYATATKGSLRLHKRVHTGEKPYKCSECKYVSSQKGRLAIHKRTHTGEKPYKCNECEYASTQKCGLIVHMRTHTGERPYKCNECKYTTSRQSGLILHKRIHIGEKPYKCNECEYATAQKCHLIVHMRGHFSERP